MAVRVNVDSRAFTDPRFKILGQLLETTTYDALGRMNHVWGYCTEHGTTKIKQVILDVITDCSKLSELLVASDLAVLDGEFVRIKGTKGRIEWLKTCRRNGKMGGRPKKPVGYPPVTEIKPKVHISEKHTSTSSTTSTSTKLNTNTIDQTKVRSSDINLDLIYQSYPRKIGKQKGLTKLKSQIKTQDDLTKVNTALERFKSYLSDRGTEPQFIPHFSTWVNSWKDWLDPAAGSAEKMGSNGAINWDYVFEKKE